MLTLFSCPVICLEMYKIQFWQIKPKENSKGAFPRKVSSLLRKRHQRKGSSFLPPCSLFGRRALTVFQKIAHRRDRARRRSWDPDEVGDRLASGDWRLPYFWTCRVRWSFFLLFKPVYQHFAFIFQSIWTPIELFFPDNLSLYLAESFANV